MTIIVPLESPSLLDPSSRGLGRPKVVGCDIDMVPVWFNADVVGALVTARLLARWDLFLGRKIYHALLCFRLKSIKGFTIVCDT